MASDFLAQCFSDRTGERIYLNRLDSPWSFDVDWEIGYDPARTAGQNNDAIAQTHGFTDIVGYEQDSKPGFLPEAFQFFVQNIAGHRVKCAKRFVHQ